MTMKALFLISAIIAITTLGGCKIDNRQMPNSPPPSSSVQ